MKVMTEPPETNDQVFVTQQDLDRLIKKLDTGERLATLSSVKLGEEAGTDLARKRFYAFRQLMRPDMHWNWWTREVSDHLEQFYRDMLAGKRPRLALMAPPQHGKTLLITPIGRLATKELGPSRGSHRSRAATSVCCSASGRRRFSIRDHRRSGHRQGLEPRRSRRPGQGPQGSQFKDQPTTPFGVGSSDDFYSRLDDKAGVLIIMTRWHVDDLLGRLLERHLHCLVGGTRAELENHCRNCPDDRRIRSATDRSASPARRSWSRTPSR
jgi:hypothetical protein